MKLRQIAETVEQTIAGLEAAGHLLPNTGIAVCALQNGEIAFEGGFGYADRERKIPVTSQTIFEVSSLTKGMTATALLTAHEAGKIDLERPVNYSSPLVPLRDPDVARRISLADILSHRTGLPPHDCLWYFSPGRIEELIPSLPHLELVPNAFRKTFIYNNLMYGTLAPIFSAWLGEGWEQHLTRNYLQPLKMRASSFRPSPNEPNSALPYLGSRRVERKETIAIAPAGALRSNVEDLGRWIEFHLKRADAPAALRMQREQIRIENPNPLLFTGLEWLMKGAGYGFGWFVSETRGTRVVFHPGFIDGYSVALVMLPERGLGFAALANANLSSAPGRIIESLLAEMLGEPRPEPPTPVAAPETASPPAARLPNAYSGTYRNDAYGSIRLDTTEVGSAFTYHGHRWPFRAFAGEEGLFTLTAFGLEIPMPAVFESDPGRVEAVSIPLSFDPRVKPLRFVRA